MTMFIEESPLSGKVSVPDLSAYADIIGKSCILLFVFMEKVAESVIFK